MTVGAEEAGAVIDWERWELELADAWHGRRLAERILLRARRRRARRALLALLIALTLVAAVAWALW